MSFLPPGHPLKCRPSTGDMANGVLIGPSPLGDSRGNVTYEHGGAVVPHDPAPLANITFPKAAPKPAPYPAPYPAPKRMTVSPGSGDCARAVPANRGGINGEAAVSALGSGRACSPRLPSPSVHSDRFQRIQVHRCVQALSLPLNGSGCDRQDSIAGGGGEGITHIHSLANLVQSTPHGAPWRTSTGEDRLVHLADTMPHVHSNDCFWCKVAVTYSSLWTRCT